MSFTARDGRLFRGGREFVAVGVDYHPSVAGCRLWSEWDPATLRRDFGRIVDAGFTTVRLFVFWRDFEPEPGRYAADVLERLREGVAIAGEAGLSCVVSLLTIWMNGQRLDLPWRGGRSLWRDEWMLERQEAFARLVARTLMGQDNLLAVDLGDEIGNVDAHDVPTRREVAVWQDRLARAVRAGRPGTLVTQANDASGVLGDAPFAADNASGLDLIAVHAFPSWAPGSIESTMSYKATSLVPFLVRFAAAYGVPFVDELGSYGVDERTAARYLGASAASAVANGAAGVVAWCWQDIASRAEPYAQRPTERDAGLCRRDGSPKPALGELRRVAQAAQRLSPGRLRARVALYVPEHQRGERSSYLDAASGTVATFFAYLLLKRAHIDADIVTGTLDGYQLVFCPSVTHVTATDLDRLHRHVDGGGTLYYSMGDHLHGFPGSDLVGVERVDYALAPDGKTSIAWDDGRWPLDWSAAPGARPTTVAGISAEPVGYYPDGSGAVFVDRGRVVFCAAPLERQLDRPGVLTGRPWERLYRWVAELAGVAPTVDCAAPDVEVVPDRRDPPAAAVVVNHGSTPVRTVLSWDGTTVPVELEAKDWQIVSRGAARGEHGRVGGQAPGVQRLDPGHR
jgi:hypothetical protein